MTKKPTSWSWMPTPMPHQVAFADKWANKTLADFALERAEAGPDALYFANVDGNTSRAGIWQQSTSLAVSMHNLGLRQGDVIAFQTPNWLEAAVINLAAALSGLIVNPIVPIYRDAEVRMMLKDCGAKAFFVAAEFRRYSFADMAARISPDLPDLQHIILVRPSGQEGLDYKTLIEDGAGQHFDRPNVDPSAVKMVLYTSGTTGKPKAVLHSHNSLTRVMQQSAQYWSIEDGAAIIMPSPVTHVSGYANGLEMPFIAGSCTILMESWNTQEALDLINKYQAIGTVAATPFLSELANAAKAANDSLPSFRFFACGGAAVPDEVIPEANAAFANCHAFRVFGASEVPLVTMGYPSSSEEQLAATTDGKIVDYDVLIVDEQERPLSPGIEGEILARGPAMFVGYADEQQTSEAINQDGYFRTGDLGIVTKEGSLTITGRKKDLIIRGGENISAREIEDILHSHPSVKEATVVAMPHERLGEGICAYVILKEDALPDASTLAKHIESSGLAKQKIPEKFLFVTDLPRTASGKIRKDRLRDDVKQKIAAGG